MRIRSLLIAISMIALATVIASPMASAVAGITLSPDNGATATTIRGTDFLADIPLTITWAGTSIPFVSDNENAHVDGTFTAIISVLNQNTPGVYAITISDGTNTASENYTVNSIQGAIGTTGSAGASIVGPKGDTGATGIGQKGEKGDTGAGGSQGLPGTSADNAFGILACALAAVGFLFGIVAYMKK